MMERSGSGPLINGSGSGSVTLFFCPYNIGTRTVLVWSKLW